MTKGWNTKRVFHGFIVRGTNYATCFAWIPWCLCARVAVNRNRDWDHRGEFFEIDQYQFRWKTDEERFSGEKLMTTSCKSCRVTNQHSFLALDSVYERWIEGWRSAPTVVFKKGTYFSLVRSRWLQEYKITFDMMKKTCFESSRGKNCYMRRSAEEWRGSSGKETRWNVVQFLQPLALYGSVFGFTCWHNTVYHKQKRTKNSQKSIAKLNNCIPEERFRIQEHHPLQHWVISFIVSNRCLEESLGSQIEPTWDSPLDKVLILF